MNKRCIVSVGTGEFYCKNLDRLEKSFYPCIDVLYHEAHENGNRSFINYKGSNKGIDLMLWRNSLPPGSRPHSESPYGFKVHAIKAAYEKGYTSILWLDSAAYSVKEDVSPIFEKIEKEGYYVMCKDDVLENWVGDKCMEYFAFKDHDLKGKNLPSGSCYGFDFTKVGETIFSHIYHHEKIGLFKSEVIGDGKWHRHDEACLAMILTEMELSVFSYDPLFQSDSPECVIKSGGWL